MKEYYNPVNVISTADWIKECKKYLDALGIRNPIIITSKGTLERLELGVVFNESPVYYDISPNPTFVSTKKALDFCRDLKCDGVIAIGGGSVMDTAKVVMAAKGTGIYAVGDLLDITGKYSNRVSAIFIPTTHGTGSEVTKWGTLWDMEEKKKNSIAHPDLYPDIAILDASLTLSLALDISLTTALDALSHSFEAIWNKNANPRSTEYAIESICLVCDNVNILKNDLYDLQVRQNLLKASNIAGMAFSNTKTAASHSIGYPLTAHFGIPHGIASSLTLVPLLKRNGPYIKHELEDITNRLKLSNTDEIAELILSIPSPVIKFDLRGWGVSYEDLDWLTPLCFARDRMGNNITELSESDVRLILEEIL
ncbi:phosphonoacetaldehyde reductase [Chloroflexota bacterium]